MEDTEKHNPDPLGRLQFVRQHDGSQEQISPEKTEQAANDFNEMFTDAFLRHAAHTMTYGDNDEGKGIARIPLLVKPGDGSKISINLRSGRHKTDVFSEPTNRSVRLCVVDANGKLTTDYSYELDASGTKVIRANLIEDDEKESLLDDLDKVTPVKSLSDIYADGSLTEEERRVELEQWQKNMGAFVESEKGAVQLEKDMGLNYQPVDADEVTGLKKLIETASIDQELLASLGYSVE